MVVSTDTATDALFEQLLQVEGKAEIVGGSIVQHMPTGEEPGLAALQIVVSLFLYAQRTGQGRAVGDNVTFRVDLPGENRFRPLRLT